MRKLYNFGINVLGAAMMISVAGTGEVVAGEERSAAGGIDEIVVTAEHREASLQKTQISITAMPAEAIEDLGISTGLDVGQYVPNVHTHIQGGSTMGFSPTIRGVHQSEVYVTFDPSAALYIDDVLIPRNPGALLDILDMERIEVLRGPQGTLYGRNTIAGAMNFITKKPTDELEGSMRFTFGTENQRDIRGVLNLPLLGADSEAGALNLRVAGAVLNRDGLLRNELQGAPVSEYDTVDREVLMTHLQWEPTDALTLRYTYDRTRIDEVPDSQFVTTVNPSSPVSFLVGPYSVRQSNRPTTLLASGPMHAGLDVDGHALNITYDIGEKMTLTSITGYRDMESGGINGSFVPFALIETGDHQELDTFTQEIRLTGTAMDDRLNYSLGAFFMEEDGEAGFRLAVFGSPVSDTFGEFDNSNWAVYGQATYALTDRWSITGGLRYTEEEREMSKAELLTPAVVYPDAKRDFDNISPMVSIGYQWNENINTYFKVSSGYQSGGFNVRDIDPADFARGFDEEKMVAFELGIKAMSSDQRFRTNLAFWFSDYDDKLVSNFIPAIASNVIRNAGAVDIYGMELEFLANLTDRLQVGLDYGLTKPDYKKYDDGFGNDLSDVTSFSYTPEKDVHAFASYTMPGPGVGVLSARVDYSYRESIRFLSIQPERNSGRNLGLVDARVTLDKLPGPGGTSVRISAWVKNLTDESYWDTGANIYDAFGFDVNSYGDPRLLGVDFEVSF